MSSPRTAAPARHLHRVPTLRIALLGAGPLPADGDGSGTRAEEVGRRLAARGHAVRIYATGAGDRDHLGMRRVRVPRRSGALVAATHLDLAVRQDVVLVLGLDAAPLLPLLRARGTAVAVHVEPLSAERWLRAAEQAAVREADALVTDDRVVQREYGAEFGVPAELIRYGAPILTHTPTDLVERLGLVPGGFHLARFESAAGVVLDGFHRSGATLPLVVLGAPAGDRLRRLAEQNPRIRVLGEAPDPRLVDQLHAHALSSVHSGSAAATRAMIRAMGAATAVVAADTEANRAVAGTAASLYRTATELARRVEEVERYPFRFRDIGELMQERARRSHGWDAIAESYEALAAKLARGYSIRGMSDGRRLPRQPATAMSRVGAHVRA